jgi:hypothetical protein
LQSADYSPDALELGVIYLQLQRKLRLQSATLWQYRKPANGRRLAFHAMTHQHALSD